jgi:hypothetical protein
MIVGIISFNKSVLEAAYCCYHHTSSEPLPGSTYMTLKIDIVSDVV